MYQQTLFDCIETDVAVPQGHFHLSKYDFSDIFITTDNLTQEHNECSLAILGDAINVLKKMVL